ncbi:MAG: hypothetical protein KC477_17275, partial [Oceanospirillaceae bacterium]|nr:hypothetical protein [Oceanospirillaceae bacterium]
SVAIHTATMQPNLIALQLIYYACKDMMEEPGKQRVKGARKEKAKISSACANKRCRQISFLE